MSGMLKGKKKAWYEARDARFGRVLDNIERGAGGRFKGADFQAGYSFLLREIVQLQREFNERFAEDMPDDTRIIEFYDRLIQILESGETVLLDSAGSMPALLERQEKLLQANAALDARAKQMAADNEKKQAEAARQAAKKGGRTMFRKDEK